MRKSLILKLLLTALFAALTAAGAIFHIADASFQSMFSVMAGILLGPIWGPISQIVYILLGLVGLPIFIAGSGIAYVTFPTFGYLLGMVLAAFITGILTEKTEWNIWLISALGFLSVYLLGIPYTYICLKYISPEYIEPGQKMTVLAAVNIGIVNIPADFGKWFIAAPISKRLLPIWRKDLYQ